MTESESAVLFRKLFENAKNPRQRTSLEGVKAACDFFDSTQTAITPTTVGRYCEERWGGPKAQSIRNSTDTLFSYLKARSAEQVLPAAAKNETYEPRVQDETVRAYIDLIKAERDEAVRAKNRIIEGLRKIPGVPIDEFIRNGIINSSDKQAEQPPKQAPFPAKAKEAIEILLNPGSLSPVGLELYKARIRNATTNKVLLEKDHVEALSTLVSNSTPSDNESAISRLEN